MSADKRSFTDFENFPGEVNKETNNYEFPKLFKTDAKGKVREWAVYIRLIKEDSQNKKETKKQNWNLLAEDQIPIKNKYITDTGAFPEGALVELWTESGISEMNITRSSVTYVEGKLAGKKNERNPLQQALVNARGKYEKKRGDGSSPNLNELNVAVEVQDQGNIMYYPMLSKNYKDIKAKDKPKLYPAEIQPKLDGVRCLIYLRNNVNNGRPTYKDVIMYSRQLKDFPYNESNDSIRKAVLPGLIKYYDTANNESVYLDGEFYKHGMPLQDINSIVRSGDSDSKKKSKANSDKNAKAKANDESSNDESSDVEIEYHIFDMFYPKYDKESFTMRKDLRQEIIVYIDSPLIVSVETKLVENQDELDEIYNDFLEKNYEGIMIRDPNSAYLKSATVKSDRLRSKSLLKRKEVFDDEFEVIDYTQGENGKEVGAVYWICAVGDETFKVVPNMPFEERYAIYKECKRHFATKYKNKLLTVEYRSKSKTGVPLCAKAVGFRDIK
jgi:ATP-dependent DNA ligase